MFEEDNSDKIVEDVQKDFDALIHPIKNYFRGNQGEQYKSYLFLLTLTKNVNEWMQGFCNAHDIDYNKSMQKIVEDNKNWEEYSNDKEILN